MQIATMSAAPKRSITWRESCAVVEETVAEHGIGGGLTSLVASLFLIQLGVSAGGDELQYIALYAVYEAPITPQTTALQFRHLPSSL